MTPSLRPQAPPAAPIPITYAPTHWLKETPYCAPYCAETEQRARASACARWQGALVRLRYASLRQPYRATRSQRSNLVQLAHSTYQTLWFATAKAVELIRNFTALLNRNGATSAHTTPTTTNSLFQPFNGTVNARCGRTRCPTRASHSGSCRPEVSRPRPVRPMARSRIPSSSSRTGSCRR
jgi:hypothetical protein